MCCNAGKKISLVLGYPISANTIRECVNIICEYIQDDTPVSVFACANPHSLILAEQDNLFQQAIHTSDLVTPDGIGIVLASKILGGNISQRVTGSDIFRELSIALNESVGKSYFFLGSTEETLLKIKSKLAVDYPNIIFAGSYSPPFKDEFSEQDSQAMIDAVNSARPDVLWVGMTAPKQEKWIHQHKDRLEVKFIGAVGAVFDFYVGNVKRSHPVFQKMGLEWLPRMIQEPRRLFKRNFVSSPLFLFKVFQQKFRQ